jgi:SPOR domain
MDQENTKGQEKRNWRERLGIGAQGGREPGGAEQGGKELPRISEGFRKEAPAAPQRPVSPARPAPRAPVASVKPAPMAPRANPKAINPTPVSPEKLAERLRNQREATTRMADQRVQAAKQRIEPQAPPPAAAAPAAKPKFSFAEENAAPVNGGPAPKPAAASPPPVQPAAPPPQLAPARPPLGAGPATQPPVFQPRPNTPPPYQVPPTQAYPQGTVPPVYSPGYGAGPVPPYRPIDPMTGYPAQPGYSPQQPPRSYGVPQQQGGFGAPNGPRLNMPQRPDLAGKPMGGLNPNYPPNGDYGAAPQPGFAGPNPRLTRPPMRGPQGPAMPQDNFEDDGYDEVPTPRAIRPNSTDYQQAYREAEYGYDDEEPRSKTPWILAGLLLLTLVVASLGVWLYQSTWKPMMNGQSASQEVPAVAAPETPAKVETEATANNTPATAPSAATPTKKQIYDRIVGDQEVLGGEVGAPAETPAAIPEPSNAGDATTAPAGTGEDPAPLPIPPPPGSGDQQGSLDPANAKQSAETITPAAGENQAAVAAQDQVASADIDTPPTPGDGAAPPLKTRGLDAPADPDAVVADESIVDTPAKKLAVKKAKPKAVAEKKLGGKPVVLVPPSKKKRTDETRIEPLIADEATNDTGGGLYGSTDITASVAAPTQTPTAPPKKRRTLADLFKSSNDQPADNAQVASVEPPAAPAPKKLVAAPPKPEAPQATGGGFVVQLASFRSRAEATSEFSRLRSKHGGTLSPYAPIITEAVVGGSTRYRLSVGSMASQSQANAVCSSLFAKGERDCLVKKL